MELELLFAYPWDSGTACKAVLVKLKLQFIEGNGHR